MFDKSKIGHRFPPFKIELTRTKIGELALAIGDTNPIYQSREAAQEAGYPDTPLPPTGFTMFMFWGNTQFVEHLGELGINVTRVMHMEESCAYIGQVQPGDILTGVTTVIDGKTRRMPGNTTIDLVTLEIHYTNQQNEHVLTTQSMFVVRE